MALSTSGSFTSTDSWIRNLPYSRMIFPRLYKDRAKYVLWQVFTPLHPALRGAAERFGITSGHFVKHERPGRQKYLLGTISPGTKVESVVRHLLEHGYGNHFIAWKDEGEIVSLRWVESFIYQYHIRIFEDGEVRGHYEYTPECYPFRHLKGMHQEDRREEFLSLLKGFIVPHEPEAQRI